MNHILLYQTDLVIVILKSFMLTRETDEIIEESID